MTLNESLSAAAWLQMQSDAARARFEVKTRGWRRWLWYFTPYGDREFDEWRVIVRLWGEVLRNGAEP